MGKRISIGSWAYTIGPYASHPVPFGEVCDQLKALGFDGVELGAFPPHPNPGNPNGPDSEWPGAMPEKSQRADLKAELAAKGLGLSGIAANLWGEKLINTDDQTKYISEFKRNAEFAQDLGIGGVRVDAVQPPTILRDVDYDTALKRVVSTWKTCAEIASDYGLYVTWEFEPGFAFNKPSDIARVHDGVNRPNFGLMYDTCHGQMVGVNGTRQEGKKEVFPNQVEFLRFLTGRINHIHLIDSDNTCHKDAEGNDETSAHPPFGQGVIDFDEVLPALIRASAAPHNWWTIDLCFWPDAWKATESCKKAVDKLNARYGG
ncbi:sugar phosphate isomerase/epimerase family protein [uncultured Paludibaculum sp.]|uniref:sugar phosphate isomerase/epimerase family protein n=1 Tax=uncultured Paludibaculum sp. TaxID=1765020 RepID=UPI002AAC02DD|nr:sugar phosphate isomerase/epimerase family protein [uncultured Paludibaculum sp.]